MYKVKFTPKIKRDMELMEKRGKDLNKIKDVLFLLASGKPIPPRHRDHALSGKWRKLRELHIEPDWLLIYEVRKNELVVVATRTGSHSDLFR